MPATTVRELLWRVSFALNDYAPQFVRWQEQELVMALDDAQSAIAKFLPGSSSRTDSIKLVAGTKQSIDFIPLARVIPGDGSSPADVYGLQLVSVNRNEGSNGTTPGRAIRLTDMDAMDASDPMWHSKSAASITRYAFEPLAPRVFWVYPGVASGSDTWVSVTYLAQPKKIPNPGGAYLYSGSNTTTISVDDRYADDLFHYVLARGAMKDMEEAGMNAIFQSASSAFVSSINAQATALTGVNPNLKSLPFTPTLPAAAR